MRSTLFTIFGLPVRAYGTMIAVGAALGAWRAVRVAKKRYGIDPERVYDLALVCVLGGIVGSRIVYVLLNPHTESWGQLYAVWNGGLSFHGGVAFAVLCGWIYTARAKLSFAKCADLLAPSVAIGYAVARIGCFLNGCCYGAPTCLPWGVRFCENGHLTPPSHPTQIYAAIASLAIFLVLARLERLQGRPGFVFASYLGLYSIYRFAIEFLREGYSAKVWLLGLTQAQWASVVVLAGAVVILAVLLRRR